MKEPILITGGTGFLGKNLVEKLQQEGKEITAAGRVGGDLLTPEGAHQVVQGHKTVFHLAASVGGIGANQDSPYRFWRENLLMGLNVIQACIDAKVEKLIVVGTVCSYPKVPEVIPFKEQYMWDGYPEETNAPYGIAKRAICEGLRAAHLEHGLCYAFPIPTNLYGPEDNFDPRTSHVIPAMIRKFIEAKESGAEHVVLWGTGQPSRDFLFVEDCADALILCANKLDPLTFPTISSVNLSSGAEVSIGKLAEIVRHTVGYEGAVLWDIDKPDGQPRRCVDAGRARRVLNWGAMTKLADGIRKTVQWYELNRVLHS